MWPQSGHFGGVRLATNYDFSGACWHVCGESDNFSHLAEVCVAVRTISGRNYYYYYFASGQFLFGLTHTYLLGGPDINAYSMAINVQFSSKELLIEAGLGEAL